MTQFTARQGRVSFGVLCFLGLALLSAPAAAEKNGAYYQSLQKRLIADGFDAAAIRELYARPEVKFETKGIAVYFVHQLRVNTGYGEIEQGGQEKPPIITNIHTDTGI